ncbi:MAG: hypothetical protein JO307_10990 [Bryobacterales bacterium]|nr:hypothetical protein [Bryobacterales bacterium]MBV9399916.1 hypothetical protein [Bryobacterales bacterium]
MKKVNSKRFAAAATLAATLSIASAQTNQVAYIPAGSNLSTIKFEGVKMVTLASSAETVPDGRCEIAERSEPGGSMFCAPATAKTFERVYKVTYSYQGHALASDEYNNTHYTFSVYFRPEELSDAERRVLSIRKGGRADVAAMFEWTTSRDVQPSTVIDNSKSIMCQGTYVDGAWARSNVKCQDHVEFKTVAAPSDYVAVAVNLAHRTGVAAAE